MRTISTIIKLSYIISMILLLTGCGNNADKKHQSENDNTVSEVTANLPDISQNQELQKWEIQIKKDYPHFSIHHFERKNENKLVLKSAEPFSQDKWNTFQPYFIFSPNHHFAIDLYSYGNLPPDSGKIPEGGSPESEINLVSLSDKTKTQLLFAGSGTDFQVAEWINDSIIIITGESDANEQNKMQPVIWKVNIRSGTITEFAYPSDTLNASF